MHWEHYNKYKIKINKTERKHYLCICVNIVKGGIQNQMGFMKKYCIICQLTTKLLCSTGFTVHLPGLKNIKSIATDQFVVN